MIKKYRSIIVSERVLDLVVERLNNDIEMGYKIDGWLDTFYNSREQGFALTIFSEDLNNPNRTKTYVKVWVCECRNSDNIMVAIERDNLGHLFSEKAYNDRTFFEYNQLQESADFIVEKVREIFEIEYSR